MAISRPFQIALLGAILVGAVFLLTRAGADGSEDGDPTVATTAAVDGVDAPASDADPDPAGSDGPTGSEPGADEATGSEPAADAGRARARGVPRQMARALERGKVAVVVLYQPGAAEDEATLAAVRDLEQVRDDAEGLRGGVEIFTDAVTDAGEYLGLTATLGITQVPAVAIVRPNGEARLLEGYQDRGSLSQHLADAQR